jgi:uncharacterized protein
MTHWPPPQIAQLPGDRFHLQHGPIDLVLKAEGEPAHVARAYAAATSRFRSALTELVAELPLLRGQLSGLSPPQPKNAVARRMVAACWPHRAVFITPMAAVAGSVADEIRGVMLAAVPDLRTLYVNNGGDIAVHVATREILRIGLVPDLARAAPDGVATIIHDSGIGGIATSGWRGRSFSLGIADAVTVLARSAAEADAAATIIANAVNVDNAAIIRSPARLLDPDSDLGDLPVTTDVGPLSDADARQALEAGFAVAHQLISSGLIMAAALALQDQWQLAESRTRLFGALA